jgi:hypothetical protein
MHPFERSPPRTSASRPTLARVRRSTTASAVIGEMIGAHRTPLDQRWERCPACGGIDDSARGGSAQSLPRRSLASCRRQVAHYPCGAGRVEQRHGVLLAAWRPCQANPVSLEIRSLGVDRESELTPGRARLEGSVEVFAALGARGQLREITVVDDFWLRVFHRIPRGSGDKCVRPAYEWSSPRSRLRNVRSCGPAPVRGWPRRRAILGGGHMFQEGLGKSWVGLLSQPTLGGD